MENDKIKYERELILRLRADDQKAFGEVYLLYRKPIFSTVYRFIRSKEFAEDIYQDTFTTIWQKRKALNPDSSFSSLIYTIMRNKVFDHLRRVSKYESLPESFLSLIDENPDVTEQLNTIQLQSLLDRELEKLSKDQRRVFSKSRDENLSYREIANDMGISIDRVNYLLCGALRSLRCNLSKYTLPILLWFIF